MLFITKRLAHSRLTPLIAAVFLFTAGISAAIIFSLFQLLAHQNAQLDKSLHALAGIADDKAKPADKDDVFKKLAGERAAVRDAEIIFKTQVQEWKNTLLRGSDSASRKKYWTAFNEESDRLRDLIQAISAHPSAPEAKPVLASFDSAHRAMQTKYTEAYETFDRSQGKDFSAADKWVKGQDRAPAASLDSLVSIYGNAINGFAESERRALARSRNIIVFLSLLALVFIGMSLWVLLGVLERFTLDPMRQALAVMEKMAGGDLRVEAKAETRNEAGRLLEASAKAASSLRELLDGTAKRFQELSVSAEQLQGVSLGLDQGAAKTHDEVEGMRRQTESVNQQVQSVAAATEEMGVCIQEIAQNAQEAANQSTTAANEAEVVTGGLNEVGDASAKIEDILQVIQRIAEQTHLLALNSSIEAARAGEAGKGFNVVATEIKELSHSTSNATGEIQQRIIALRRSVGGMTGSMANLRSEVLSMRDRIGAIATAIEEQTNTTREISRNVESTARASQGIENGSRNLEDFARTSKDRSKEARSAAEGLKALAVSMEKAMSAFKI